MILTDVAFLCDFTCLTRCINVIVCLIRAALLFLILQSGWTPVPLCNVDSWNKLLEGRRSLPTRLDQEHMRYTQSLSLPFHLVIIP